MSTSFNRLVLLTVLTVLCKFTSAADTYCAKINFNRTIFPEFHECKDKHLPTLIGKRYAANTEPNPSRPNITYYLSNNFESYSCLESSKQFSMDANTVFEVAVLLKSVGISYLEINIFDADRNFLSKTLRTAGTNGWNVLRDKLHSTIKNARVRNVSDQQIAFF